jgi:hypothetical protein
MKAKNTILNALVNEIHVAQTSCDKIATLAEKAKAAKVTPDELTESLRDKWGYADTKPKSNERAKIRMRVIYWVKVVFGKAPMTDAAKKSMRDGRRKAIAAVLVKHNIPQAKAVKIAAELVK